MGKGENAGYQHFLLFPQYFQKASFSGLLKVGIVCLRVKVLSERQQVIIRLASLGMEPKTPSFQFEYFIKAAQTKQTHKETLKVWYSLFRG